MVRLHSDVAARGFTARASKNGRARHLDGSARLQILAAELVSPSDAASHARHLMKWVNHA